MIIKKLNHLNLDRVIKHEDLEQIFSLEAMLQHQQHCANEIIQDANNSVSKLKTEVTLELQALNAKYLAETEAKLATLLNQLEDGIYATISRILDKCGFMALDVDQLKRIVGEELYSMATPGVLRVTAHSLVLSQLSLELEHLGGKVVFQADDSLDQGECICTSNLWSMNLNLNDVRMQIYKFLGAKVIEAPEEL